MLVKYQGEKRFPAGGSADSGSIQRKDENNPTSVVILLLEEMLLTFGTKLIAFFSSGLNSASEFFGKFTGSRGKVCICFGLISPLKSDFQPPALALVIVITVHLTSTPCSGL